ncbi:MAG: hypothetical protein QOI20_575 [Acidimicrobiaceae bacterium]|jgi:LPXTG-motif cell wall-anchored protein|nr:hypothetical protein [Acidimicrobiaceae bacterium]
MSFTVSLEVPVRPPSLPRTGTSIELMIALALLLVVAGALVLRVAR